MKHIGYTVFILATFLYACNSTPQSNDTLTLNLDEANLTWRCTYDSINHKVSYTSNWSGCGWSFGNDSTKTSADFSQYSQLVATIENISTDTTTLFLNARYSTTEVITSASAPIINGKTTLRITLDPNEKSHVMEIYVMSKRPCEITLADISFHKELQYGEEKELKVNDSFIDASEFDGYSDDAIISFNYEAKGEMTFVNDTGAVVVMNNWGIGAICSSADVIEAVCPGQQIMLEKLGKQSFTCRLGDIRYMLELKDDDGECGLYWVVWAGGNLTEVNALNATIKDVL